MMMPATRAMEKLRIKSPPKNSRASTASKVTTEVMVVRDKVWLMASFMATTGSALRILRKFSRIRSNTTTVSFTE